MLNPLRSILSAEDQLLVALLRPERVAACPVSGARLSVYLGHRRPGLRTRYWLAIPADPPTQPVSGLDWLNLRADRSHRLSACSLDEAFDSAQRLPTTASHH